MFNLFSKKPKGAEVIFKIDGMHCTSCSMNIDGELEDLDGVVSSNTSYAKSEAKVVYDPEKITPTQLKEAIEGLEYSANQV